MTNSDIILLKIEDYLAKLQRGEVTLPAVLVDEMTIRMNNRFKRENSKRKFKLVMSNIGKPLCQLQMESKGAKSERYNPHILPIRFAVGDMIEHWLMMIIKASGVPVNDTDIRCELDLLGERVGGIADIDIDNGLYDVKSTSDFQYRKYQQGFSKVYEDDPFGYVVQGAMYDEAVGRPFKGWIVINKNNGNMCICNTPVNWKEKYKPEALKVAEIAMKTIKENADFKRSFSDMDEMWYKKSTGNRILGFNCGWCDYKNVCWPGLQHHKSPFSKAKEGKYNYYTELVNLNDEKVE